MWEYEKAQTNVQKKNKNNWKYTDRQLCIEYSRRHTFTITLLYFRSKLTAKYDTITVLQNPSASGDLYI